MRRLVSVLVFGMGSAVACAQTFTTSQLQEVDFDPASTEGDTFDRDVVLDSAVFSDSEALDVERVQNFFSKTAYGPPTFLETYQSNGVRASDAVMKSARSYRVNPILLLAYVQVAEGLIGERYYPFPPDRIEYVFRCGCLSSKDCLPSFAGFDRQLDCLAGSLRTSVEQVRAEGTTVGGWGPETTTTTFDGVNVTPQSDATAAIYERTPRVAEREEGGTWMLWNIFQRYAAALEYKGASGKSNDGRWLGDACKTSAMCSGVQGAECLTDVSGGLCTIACTGTCNSEAGRPETSCASFKGQGRCLTVCNPAAPRCRAGFRCVRATGVGTTAAKSVCTPSR
jgi:hypothetical protein